MKTTLPNGHGAKIPKEPKKPIISARQWKRFSTDFEGAKRRNQVLKRKIWLIAAGVQVISVVLCLLLRFLPCLQYLPVSTITMAFIFFILSLLGVVNACCHYLDTEATLYVLYQREKALYDQRIKEIAEQQHNTTTSPV